MQSLQNVEWKEEEEEEKGEGWKRYISSSRNFMVWQSQMQSYY